MSNEQTEALPEGMVPWAGGDSAPEDWDPAGDMLMRSGHRLKGKDGEPFWAHTHGNGDIIAYTPKLATPSPSTDPLREDVRFLAAHVKVNADKLPSPDQARMVCDRILAGLVAPSTDTLDAWQPIETAPRDGTRILGIGHRGNMIDIIEWGDGRYLGRKQGYRKAWVSGPGSEISPQFWMPLPKLPALGGSHD